MLIWLLLLTTLIPTSARADHLPKPLLAQGEPETILAGVDLQQTNIDDVIRLYGPPSRKLTVPNNPVWTGYVWETARAKLEIGLSKGPSRDRITDVYVEGFDHGLMGKTGRGLMLGDSTEAIKHLYGDHFQVQDISPGFVSIRREFTGIANVRRIRIQWQSMEFTLTAGFNDAGSIAALWLKPPECYPNECH